jgi:hypothetical protein
VDITQALKASWVAAAGLTVLSSAAVAALTMVSAPVTAAAPAPVVRVVAHDQAAPAPVTLSFPAPAVQAPAPAAPAAPQVASRVTRTRPAASARRADPRCEGAGWQTRRGEAVLDRLRRPADARAVPVTFRPARPDVLGMADLSAARVDVYVRSCAKQSDALLLHVVAHELGHVVDGTAMTDELRTQWLTARGIPAGTPWFGCNEPRPTRSGSAARPAAARSWRRHPRAPSWSGSQPASSLPSEPGAYG